jgi:DNA-binding IclR family transcriptional regulator
VTSAAFARGPYRRSRPAREAIQRALEHGPGLTQAEIVRRTGLPASTVGDHLRGMVARKEVAAQRLGRRWHYAPQGLGAAAVLARRYRDDALAAALVRELNERPADLAHLCRAADASRKRVARRLQHMVEAGVVQREARRRGRFELLQVPLAWALLARAEPGAASQAAPNAGD